jgi:acyl carrier protein
MSEIEAKVKTILVEKLGLAETQLEPQASFTDDLGVDSLDVYETLTAIEKEFGVSISDEEAEKLTTVGAVLRYILERQQN